MHGCRDGVASRTVTASASLMLYTFTLASLPPMQSKARSVSTSFVQVQQQLRAPACMRTNISNLAALHEALGQRRRALLTSVSLMILMISQGPISLSLVWLSLQTTTLGEMC